MKLRPPAGSSGKVDRVVERFVHEAYSGEEVSVLGLWKWPLFSLKGMSDEKNRLNLSRRPIPGIPNSKIFVVAWLLACESCLPPDDCFRVWVISKIVDV